MEVDVERGRGHPLIQSALLGEAAELAPLGIFVVADDLNFLAVNRHGSQMLGYDRDALLHMRVSDLAVRGSDELAQSYRRLLAEGVLDVEAPVRLGDGSVRTIRYRAYHSQIAGMAVLFGFARFNDDG